MATGSKWKLALVIGGVLMVGACSAILWGMGQNTETARIDRALTAALEPDPTSEEIVETCDAMEAVGWAIKILASDRGVTRDGQDRIVDIAAAVDNARWEYVVEAKSELSRQRWARAEDWRAYCLDKRGG